MNRFKCRLDKAKQRISKPEGRPETYTCMCVSVCVFIYMYTCIYIYIWNEAWREKQMENKDERIRDIEKNSKMNINVSQNHRETWDRSHI